MAQSEKQRENTMQRDYQKVTAHAIEDKNGAENKVKKPKKVPGYRLINRIKSRSIELGVQDRYIADVIGVTPIYWYSIANGHRKISALSKDKLEKIAKFLNIPTVQAMSLADVLSHEDFFLGSLEEQLNVSIEQMRNDPAWMNWAPTTEEWDQLSIGTRTGIVMLYETVFQKMLLRRAEIENPQLKEAMQNFFNKVSPE
ncbi:helix-turn-helix domain-containing protein [Oxalobacter paraformigenes]|uniref:Uncharacterized protein n=1 Tax=Oxalobacter paraformigenes TaxID=556268 RepID=C3X281_9BURK|nr:helix-turn-helix transcriptional regulator [Oxalobacter paraformigenes]EEO27317.1 hypothetical protein OFAG_00470 [Oxalobacter paraformigenes]